MSASEVKLHQVLRWIIIAFEIAVKLNFFDRGFVIVLFQQCDQILQLPILLRTVAVYEAKEMRF